MLCWHCEYNYRKHKLFLIYIDYQQFYCFCLLGDEVQPSTVYVLQGGGDAEATSPENDKRTITITVKEGKSFISLSKVSMYSADPGH